MSTETPFTPFEVRDSFWLRKLLGAVWLGLAIAVLMLVPVLWQAEAIGFAILFVAAFGFGLFALGVVMTFPGRRPAVRLRISPDKIWILPDQSRWTTFGKPAASAVEIPLTAVTRVDDGGVFHSYRRLTIEADGVAVALHTTFLDHDLRRITDALTRALAMQGLLLREIIPPMAKRGGRWIVSRDEDVSH